MSLHLHIQASRHIVKNIQCTTEQGKIELKHVVAFISVSHRENVVTAAYPVNIIFLLSSFLRKVHRINTRQVHVSDN